MTNLRFTTLILTCMFFTTVALAMEWHNHLITHYSLVQSCLKKNKNLSVSATINTFDAYPYPYLRLVFLSSITHTQVQVWYVTIETSAVNQTFTEKNAIQFNSIHPPKIGKTLSNLSPLQCPCPPLS
ncbi:hypothetical protein EJ02DRAFT_167680 [Clathrospora elynae]|uniref:Uncharacterized protein n=1 Tax=Clathrospora elynae TaxID=706981 RepID=A0A6A5SRU4_9PLEO|nr:hypothetical protein EJ02DRAFT_167680 [Clathrospora elynae]